MTKITKPMHDAALHVVNRSGEYGLTNQGRYDVEQVMNGHVGACDEAAAERGLAVIRKIYADQGKRAPF